MYEPSRSQPQSRRQALKTIVATSAAIILPPAREAEEGKLEVRGRPVEIQITSVSPNCFRLAILPIEGGHTVSAPDDGSLVSGDWGKPLARLRGRVEDQTIASGSLRVRIGSSPLSFTIANAGGAILQRLEVDQETAVLRFLGGDAPLLGLGEGGRQFDRRGAIDEMRSGQGGYQLRTHGGRVPVPWLVGSAGWGMFIHHPFGTFDFTAKESQFLPSPVYGMPALSLYFIASANPSTILFEYAKLTGLAEIPPLWSLGYQQSHRTLASREEVLAEAKVFRQKKLPCDALIYLGTGFCPSGWNTENGSFAWNRRVFPDPKEILDELHQQHFRAVLHVVILADKLCGSVHDPCNLAQFDESE